MRFVPSIAGRLHSAFRQFRWKSALVGVVTPLLLAGGYGVVFGGDGVQGIAGEIVTIGRRDIVLSIKALGTVTLANEQQLRFNVLGKVEKVHVEEGQEVQRDDLIAEMEKTDPLADIRQAELFVNDAYLSLQKLLASRDQELLTAQNAVRDLERQLTEAYGEVPSQRQQVKDTIEQAKRTVLEKEAAYEKAQRDMAVSIQDAITDIDDLLDDIVAVLSGEEYVRGGSRFDTFDIDFLFNDYSLKNQVEFSYYDATNAYDALREKYGTVINVEDTRKLQTILTDAIALAGQIVDLTGLSYEFVQTAVPSASYTDSDINDMKSTMNTARSTAITLLDTLRDQQATLTLPGKNTTLQDLEDAEESLALLESQQENKTTAADDQERSVTNLNDKLRAEQAQLTQTQTSVDVQINQQRNTVAQKQVALQKAKSALEKYELRAPFDGIVRRIDFQVGDNLLADANETKYVVLENPDYFIVTVQLDQVDVVHVKEGQKASIVFDALPEETFEGVIDFIDTTPIQSSGVVSYEVEIALQPTGHTILSGMTAKVEIEIDARENVVAVPNLALRAIGNSSFVVGENGERFPVETGLSDGTYTEVLSGLQEGAKIQSVNVSISSNQDGERSERSSNNAQMIMRMGGPPR